MSRRGYRGRFRRWRIAAAVAALPALTAWGADTTWRELPPRPQISREAPALSVEYVGPTSGKALLRKCALWRVPEADSSRQLIWFKKDKAARESWFATVNLTTGEISERGPMPGAEMTMVVEAWGILYIGMSGPGHLLAYDPAADKMEDLGPAFEKASVARIAEGTENTLLLGAGGGSSEAALYRIKQRSFTRLGEMGGVGAGYVHALYQDQDAVYAVARGTGPWELVSHDLKTGERHVLISTPAAGTIDMTGGIARVRDGEHAAVKTYVLRDGHATPTEDKPAPKPAAQRKMQVGDWTPGMTIDESPLYAGKGCVALRCRDPVAKGDERTVEMPAVMAGAPLCYLTLLPDGRIAAAPDSGAPVVLFNPGNNETAMAPMPFVQARCIAATGQSVYVSGFPNVPLAHWDVSKPTRLPTGADKAASDANPRLAAVLAGTPTGWHAGALVFASPDGRIYVCERRQRTATGFDFRWYDPRTGGKGTVGADGALDHLQATWAAPLTGGRLAVSTCVEPNSTLKSPIPESARVVLLNLADGRYETSITPLPGVKSLAGLVECAPGKLLGLAPDPAGRSTWVYRLDLKKAELEKVSRVAGYVQCTATPAALPTRGHDLQLGPDGMVWTAAGMQAGSVLVRVDPVELTMTAVGTFKGPWSRFLFVDGVMYLSGEERLRKIVPPGAAAK